MSQTVGSSIALLCIGRLRSIALQLEQSLSPKFHYPAIIDAENYSPSNVRTLLNTLSPTPAGIMVGGGLTLEIQEEVEKVVKEFNEANGARLKLVCIPVGIRAQVGAKGLLTWLKEALGKEFGVTW